MINLESSVMIIGGDCDFTITSMIAKYTNNDWEHVGNLQSPREGHRAIVNENRIYVVGGADGTR